MCFHAHFPDEGPEVGEITQQEAAEEPGPGWKERGLQTSPGWRCHQLQGSEAGAWLHQVAPIVWKGREGEAECRPGPFAALILC